MSQDGWPPLGWFACNTACSHRWSRQSRPMPVVETAAPLTGLPEPGGLLKTARFAYDSHVSHIWMCAWSAFVEDQAVLTQHTLTQFPATVLLCYIELPLLTWDFPHFQSLTIFLCPSFQFQNPTVACHVPRASTPSTVYYNSPRQRCIPIHLLPEPLTAQFRGTLSLLSTSHSRFSLI
jgi:hypothetical protein